MKWTVVCPDSCYYVTDLCLTWEMLMIHSGVIKTDPKNGIPYSLNTQTQEQKKVLMVVTYQCW